MKCIKEIKTGNIERVHEELSDTRVKTGNWIYVSKTEYKSFLHNNPEQITKKQILIQEAKIKKPRKTRKEEVESRRKHKKNK